MARRERQSHQDFGVLSAIKKHPPTIVVSGKGEHRGIPGNELHISARVRANPCHRCSSSRQGTCQVKAAEMWRPELSASAGARVGDRELREPKSSSSTHGKGKHGASFPAPKIIPAPRFLHLPAQPEPKPQWLGARQGWGTRLWVFFEENPGFAFASQTRAKRQRGGTGDAEDILYSKTHGASVLFTLKSCSDGPTNARGVLNHPDGCRDLCEDRTLWDEVKGCSIKCFNP